MDKNKLTKKQLSEIQKMLDEITKEAKKVVEDYAKNPSEISGSVVEVNENSPFLEKEWKGDKWKKVIRGSVKDAMKYISKNKKKDDYK